MPLLPVRVESLLTALVERQKEYFAVLRAANKIGATDASLMRTAGQLAQILLSKQTCSDHHVRSNDPCASHDAYYCIRCRAFLEPVCGYSTCIYCATRPPWCPDKVST